MTIFIQYQNSPNINALVEQLKENLTISADDFFNNYFYIETCVSDGLDNWGRILNRSRTVEVDVSFDNVFGFDTGVPPPTPGAYPQNFGHGTFYSPRPNNLVKLTDTAYRALLKFTYLTLTSNGTLYNINNILNYYYKNTGKVKVYNSALMQITYEFMFALQPYERTLFTLNHVLPTPAGVANIFVETP